MVRGETLIEDVPFDGNLVPLARMEKDEAAFKEEPSRKRSPRPE